VGAGGMGPDASKLLRGFGVAHGGLGRQCVLQSGVRFRDVGLRGLDRGAALAMTWVGDGLGGA
jgi:hypothetical protein